MSDFLSQIDLAQPPGDAAPTNNLASLLAAAKVVHVRFRAGDVLNLDGEEPRLATVLSGVVSVSLELAEGGEVETALAGPGDWLGWPSPLPGCRFTWASDGVAGLVQAPQLARAARSAQLPVETVLQLTAPMVQRFQISAACHGRHTIVQRLARRLLDISRFLGGVDVIAITQDDAANALGVQRTSVTHAFVELQAKGSVKVMRGRTYILKPALLESQACGCSRQEHPR